VTVFEHSPHPHIRQRQAAGPAKVADQAAAKSGFDGFNARLGMKITILTGTMVAAYVFAAIALISLPSALTSGSLTVMIAWLSSNFLQLVLLPIILVGSNAQGAAADKRAEATYKDAEAVLHECLELQRHLHAQDEILRGQDETLLQLTAAPGKARI
jgi:hypothetical protein